MFVPSFYYYGNAAKEHVYAVFVSYSGQFEELDESDAPVVPAGFYPWRFYSNTYVFGIKVPVKQEIKNAFNLILAKITELAAELPCDLDKCPLPYSEKEDPFIRWRAGWSTEDFHRRLQEYADSVGIRIERFSDPHL